jgi:hypothetical protein
MRSCTHVAATAAVLVAGLTASSLSAATSFADPPGSLTYGDQVFSVALSQGQLYYTTYTDGVTRLVLRPLTQVAGAGGATGAVQLGPEQPLGTVANNAIAASSGRLVFDGRARTYTGQIRAMGGNALLGREASGNRALV